MSRHDGGAAERVGRILVVEDSPSARRLLQDVLLRLGATLPNLRVATSIVEALTLFTQWSPHVVFVDIELHGLPAAATDGAAPGPNDPKDGVELALLFLKRRPETRVVICSATDPSDPRLTALRTQSNVDFVLKPLLAARVQEALERVPTPRPRSSG